MLQLNQSKSIKGNASRIPLVLLSAGQLVSWGTLYYGITFIAKPVQEEMAWGLDKIFGAFSAGLFLAAIMTPPVGRFLHRHGGRMVMSVGSFLAAIALAIVASSHNFFVFQLGWLLAGIAMSMTLYEAAFSTLREIPALDFRRGLSVVTIVGGFASTLFWPLTHWLVGEVGWRIALLMYAATHILICLPFHLSLSTKTDTTVTEVARTPIPRTSSPQIVLLSTSFAIASLAAAAISSHIGLVMSGNHVPEWLAMTALAFIGPMQVIGRITELAFAHRMSSVKTGMVALMTLTVSLVFLQGLGHHSWLALVFALAFGAANGVMTVIRGTIVAEMFDRKNYALMLGTISTPAMFARALGPVMTAWMIGISNMSAAIWLLTFLMILAIIAYRHALISCLYVKQLKESG